MIRERAIAVPDSGSDLCGLRATRAIVDLDAIAGNMRALRAALPDTTRVMAVVKADGYGHGATWVARAALDAGAVSLGVATVSEGQILRANGLQAPIVLLGSIDPAEAAPACRAGLEITVADDALLDAVQRAARSLNLPARVSVHLKIDTGLRRYGAMPGHAPVLARRIFDDPCLRLAGVFTHFASADEPDEPFTAEQVQRFERAVAAIRDVGVALPSLHAANSAGILTGQGVSYDIARAGIALYGVPPSAETPLAPAMRPALRIESRISRIVPIAPGETVGYNQTFRADTSMLGALVPIGYADGYRRSLSGRAWVGLGGRPARVLGRVSMDQIVVEAPPGASAAAGDVVHILGGDESNGAPSIAEMAELMGTNAYEMLVGIRGRVPRIFIRNGETVGVHASGVNRSPEL